jgi:hypothetical protein
MRVFSCGFCGHKMRFDGERCGKCFEEKPVLKSIGFYKFLSFSILMSICAAITARALLLYVP